MTDRRLALDVLVDAGIDALPEAPLRRLAAFAARVEPSFPAGDWEMTLRLCDDQTIAELHEQYFDDPTPTDIITFPSGDAAGVGSRYLGDIVVSVETARDNARLHGHTPAREIAFLLLHGILHLCGMDDHDDADRQRMLQRQSEILEAFECETGQRW